METVKQLFIYFLMIGVLEGQQYAISILGFTASDVTLELNGNTIEFKTQSRGIVDAIWPTKNYYKTDFDPNDFSILTWEKRIKQGKYKKSLYGSMDSSGSILYKDHDKIKLPNMTQNIFTMLAMVQIRDKEYLDTRWFHYENAGSLGKARFVWADSSNAWNGKDSILCDHYRFDVKTLDSTKHIKTNDFFLNNINDINTVRELWVSRSNPKQIISAKINNGILTVKAQIQINPKL